MKVTNKQWVALIEGLDNLGFTVIGITSNNGEIIVYARPNQDVKPSRASKTPKAARKPRKPKQESHQEPGE